MGDGRKQGVGILSLSAGDLSRSGWRAFGLCRSAHGCLYRRIGNPFEFQELGELRSKPVKAQRKAPAVRSVLFLCGLILVCGPNVRAQTEGSTKTWAATSIRGVSTERPAAEWWNSFHDEELTRLIRRVVANNLDLRLAAARVDEARAARGIAKSALSPSVWLTTTAERPRD